LALKQVESLFAEELTFSACFTSSCCLWIHQVTLEAIKSSSDEMFGVRVVQLHRSSWQS
jgi:hypothetical protein